MSELDLNLREFIYIDTQKVIDLISSIENGLPKEIQNFEKMRSGELGGKLNLQVIEVEKSKELKETESRESKIPTDASIFNRLYKSLKNKTLIKSELDNIKIGDVIEITGNFIPSSMDTIFDLIKPFMPYIESGQQQSSHKSKQIKKQAITASKGPSTNEIVCMLTDNPGFSYRLISKDKQIFSKALKKYLRIKLNEIEGDYTVIGRVRKIIAKEDRANLFSIKGVQLPETIIMQMINSFPKEMKMYLGRGISEEDFTITGPAIEISTIAAYI